MTNLISQVVKILTCAHAGLGGDLQWPVLNWRREEVGAHNLHGAVFNVPVVADPLANQGCPGSGRGRDKC